MNSVQHLYIEGRPVRWCCGPKVSINGSECRNEQKSRLLRSLLENENVVSCDLVHDGLGRPVLLLNDIVGPGVSFTHCNGMTWAALTSRETDVGIDAERPEEFGADYPFQSVFRGGELARLLKEGGYGLSESAALAWSAKEAFVKTLGCGFHLFSPHEVSVAPVALQPERALLSARISPKGLELLNSNRGSQMHISSFRIDGVWVSVTAVNRNHTARSIRHG